MQLRKKGSSKFFAFIMVVLMVLALISTALTMNADAINANMTVGPHGVFNSTPALPATLAAGQVATAKNVADTGGAQGQFTVTYSAIGGRSYVEGYVTAPIITSDGITFKDTFTNEYAFVTYDAGTHMDIKIDGVPQTLTLTTDTYEFSDYTTPLDPTTLIKVTIDPSTNKIEYFIGAGRLHLTSGPMSSEASLSVEATPNTLAFDVRLLDSVNYAGTFNTNGLNSCTAEYDTLASNEEDDDESFEHAYSNVYRAQLNVWGRAHFNRPWLMDNFDIVRLLLVDDMSTDRYYEFFRTGGHLGIAQSTRPGEATTADDYWYDMTVESGIYTGLHAGSSMDLDIIEVLPPSFSFTYHFDIPGDYVYVLNNSGTINKLTEKEPADQEFDVIIEPSLVGESCNVDIGGTSYVGPCTVWTDSTHWSFTSGQYQITRNGKYDLVLVYTARNSDGGEEFTTVTHTHNAYGYVTLSTPFIQNDPLTGSLAVSKVVAEGDSESEEFAFTVTFAQGTSTNANYLAGIEAPSGATVNGGVYTLSLSEADGVVTFRNIPVGVTYTVAESITGAQGLDGWSADADNTRNTTGTIGTAVASAIVANEQAEVQGTSDIETPSPEPSLNVAPSPEPSSNVAGDSDILPQTDGISASTLIGIFGLMIIAIGGTAFTIFKKKFQG